METLTLIVLIILFLLIIISCNSLTPINQYVSIDSKKSTKKQLTQKDIDDIRQKCNMMKKDDDSELTQNILKEKDYYYLNKNKEEPQLYHIYPNVYTFLEAKNECKKRNGRLATTQEIQSAYDTQNAHWCSWGWADDENAYMPNRSKKCNKDVGVINAEVIDPYLRLGTHCYGVPQ